MLVKLAKIGYEWKYIALSDDEEIAVRSKHMEATKALMVLALKDAEEIFPTGKPEVTALIAKALFEKRCDAIYSVLQRELDNAVATLGSGQK